MLSELIHTLFSSRSNESQPRRLAATPSSTFIDPLASDPDPDSILESRLRALNPSSTTLKSNTSSSSNIKDKGKGKARDQDLHSLLGSNFLDEFKRDQDRNQDSEIQALLESTSKQVELERNHSNPEDDLSSGFNPGERIFGKVEDISSDSESDSDGSDIEDGLSSPRSSSQKKDGSTFNYSEESGKLKKEADELIGINKQVIDSTPSTSKLPQSSEKSSPLLPVKIEKVSSEDSKSRNQSGLLVVEPKERPTLSRSSSNLALEDELANAMKDDLEPFTSNPTTQATASSSRDSDSTSTFKSIETPSKETKSESPTFESDLASRFASLQSNRSSKTEKEKEKEISNQSFLNLPSVPTSIPSPPDSPSSTKVSTSNLHINESIQDDDEDNGLESNPFSSLPSAPTSDPISTQNSTANDHQDLDGVDLSSFSKLVRLNANDLSDPGSFAAKRLKDQKKKEKDEEEGDEIENWCCICNEDANVKCEGCDLDPYCSNCWAEGHSNMLREELREHRTLEIHGKRTNFGKGRKGGGDGGKRLMAA